MKGVSCLVGSIESLKGPFSVFSDEVIAFFSDLSKMLLRSASVRVLPDVATFAYWCRKANLEKVIDQHPSSKKRMGRGLALHIAPSNVPVNFAFSYAFSLLAGNPTIVRVPSRDYLQVNVICEAIADLLPSYPEVAARTALVRYSSDSSVTEQLSAHAAVRVVWGGDSTVSSIRAIAASPRCIDIVFPDRYSICIMDDSAVAVLDEKGLERLVRSFYNDTYAMDQNACSSPHVVFWMGNDAKQRDRFWEALASLAEREYDIPAVIAMDKFDQSCRDAFELDGVRILRHGSWLYRIQLPDIPKKHMQKCDLRGVAGYFYECDLKNFEELARFIGPKYQTVTYFGLDSSKLGDAVVSEGLEGIDRIVPIGSSLDIGTYWDGYDLIAGMSRVVDVR